MKKITQPPQEPQHDLPGEIWQPLKCWKHHKYLISNMGRIKSKDITKSHYKLGHIIKRPHVQRYGGTIMNLADDRDGSAHTKYFSTLMKQFLPKQPSKKHKIYHKNGDRGDNRAENLCWMTQREINLDGMAKGIRTKPKRVPRMTFKQYEQIKKYHQMGYTHVKIAKLVGCHNSSVGKFIRRNGL